MTITQEVVKRFFHYEPDTGNLLRIAKLNKRGQLFSVIPQIIRNDNGAGYTRVSVDGCRYFAHTIIYIYMTGKRPIAIDHIDGDKQNNKWVNLREVNHQSNMLNKGTYRSSKTGVPGVTFCRGDYVAIVQKEGVREYLGKFSSLIDAQRAVLEFRTKSGFHPNHGARPSWRG